MNASTWIRLTLLAAVVAAVVVLIYVFAPSGRVDPGTSPHSTSDDSPDPRLTFNTAYRNVRPDVAFVGDAACAACHHDICHTFHQQAMGRSANSWANVERIETLPAAAVPTEFAGPPPTRFRVELKNGQLLHTESTHSADNKPLVESTVAATIAIGAGRQARSYLSVREGAVFQSGVTWFHAEKRWGLSPGFSAGLHGQRPVVDTCLFCHVDRVELVPGTVNRYREPLFARQAHISCERCHGPGAIHVAEQSAAKVSDGVETSIVNPRRLAPHLRDAICQQCHLEGEAHIVRRGRSIFDFRPGLPLELFVSVFVPDHHEPDDLLFVGHVQQLDVSRCAKMSAGKMSCTSCHDPHADPPPRERAAYFRKSCLQCHAERACSAPLAERNKSNDACATCHMPRTLSADVTHIAVTDHRIVRRPNAAKPKSKIAPGRLPLVLYHATGPNAPPEPESERDLGLALAYLIDTKSNRETLVLDGALDRLQRATERFPGDVDSWEMLAHVLQVRGRLVEAFAAAERALTIQPAREKALLLGTLLGLQIGRDEQARDFGRRLVEVNPGNPLNRITYGIALSAGADWRRAAELLRTGLHDMPANSSGQAALAVCLHRLGDSTGAQVELQKAIALAPEQALSLRNWFEQRTR